MSFTFPQDVRKMDTKIMRRKRFLIAQSTLEYSVIIAVVAAALMAMSLYVRRAIQANLKVIENQINVEAIEK